MYNLCEHQLGNNELIKCVTCALRRLALGPPTGLCDRRTWKHAARTLATAF